MNKTSLSFLLILVSALVWVQPVFAYIDPGSGSAIMSAIIGFFVAIGIFIKTYWYKLKSLFTKDSSSSETEPK